MNQITKACQASATPAEFAQKYFTYLKSVLDNLDTNIINQIVDEFQSARLKGNTIFIAGNGGSATTASSMANDLGFDVLRKTNTDKPFRLLALTDNNGVMTAIGNDVGYENLFTSQLRVHYRPGDKLIVISASGNSSNIVNAAVWVKEHGGKVIGLLGFEGGKLKSICDLNLHVKTSAGEYGPVEDTHLIINHVLAHWFQEKI